MNMNFEIVNLEEKLVVGPTVKTSNLEGKAMADIGRVWGEFIQEGVYSSIESKINGKTIGLYSDYEGDFTKPYNFYACCEVSSAENTPNGMVVKKISSGKYAKFVIRGHVQAAVGEFWTSLWTMDIDRKYSCDFEEYQNLSKDINDQEIHIYIAIND